MLQAPTPQCTLLLLLLLLLVQSELPSTILVHRALQQTAPADLASMLLTCCTQPTCLCCLNMACRTTVRQCASNLNNDLGSSKAEKLGTEQRDHKQQQEQQQEQKSLLLRTAPNASDLRSNCRTPGCATTDIIAPTAVSRLIVADHAGIERRTCGQALQLYAAKRTRQRQIYDVVLVRL